MRHEVQDFQIGGGPADLMQRRFDIGAKAEDAVQPLGRGPVDVVVIDHVEAPTPD